MAAQAVIIVTVHFQVAGLVDADYLATKLGDVVPGVIRGYSHSESSVRKASVFCLVSIHAVVGDAIREHLQKLSSSQVRASVCIHACTYMRVWCIVRMFVNNSD